MKTISKSVMMAVVLVLGILCAVNSYAGDNYDKSPMRDRHGIDKAGKEELFKGLDLTTEQRDKLKAHREKTKGEMKAIHEQMREKKLALKTELDKQIIDKAKIADIATQLKTLSAQMVDQRINSILSLKEILTPEQFQKMHARMEEKMSKHGGKWGGGGKGKMHTDED